jgi:hypothetical protein
MSVKIMCAEFLLITYLCVTVTQFLPSVSLTEVTITLWISVCLPVRKSAKPYSNFDNKSTSSFPVAFYHFDCLVLFSRKIMLDVCSSLIIRASVRSSQLCREIKHTPKVLEPFFDKIQTMTELIHRVYLVSQECVNNAKVT